MLHCILFAVHVHLVVLFFGVVALKFDFDPIPIGVTCLIQAGDGVYPHDLLGIA
jgi:hypothetical protein